MKTDEIWRVFHQYDDVPGIHRRLRCYVVDNGREHLDYFVAHLSHEIYKARGIRGHSARQAIRDNLKELAEKIYEQVLRGRLS